MDAMRDFYVDERTGLVRKVHHFQVDAETARLNRKRAAERKAKRNAAKKARRRNRTSDTQP